MCKFIKILFCALILLINIKTAQAKTNSSGYKYVDLKDLKELQTFYEKDRGGFIEDGISKNKILLKSEDVDFFNEVYYESAQKYISQVRCSKNRRALREETLEFLVNWINLHQKNRSVDNYTETNKIKLEEILNNFYEEILIFGNGKSEWVIIQKTISDSLIKEIADTVDIHFLAIGRIKDALPVIIITNYEATDKIKAEDKVRKKKELTYDMVDAFLLKRNKIGFNKALSALKVLSNKYPKDNEIKLKICTVEIMRKSYLAAEKCYEDLIKNNIKTFETYYNLGKAQYYHNNILKNKSLYSKSIANLTKAINIYNQSYSTRELNNALYIRALVKIELKDKTAIDDLLKINKSRPYLISTGTIDIIRKELEGVK